MKQLPAFDLLRVTGLKPKRKPPQKYANFNQRMFAVAIDTFVMLLFVVPVIDGLLSYYFGDSSEQFQQLMQAINAGADGVHNLSITWHEIVNTGFIKRWTINTVLQTGVLCLYSGVCWHYWGATPGKMVMRLKIVDAVTEGPITDRQIVRRIIGYLISTLGLCIGFFVINYNERHQGWHDKFADTVVLIKPFPWPWKKTTPASAAADPLDFRAP